MLRSIQTSKSSSNWLDRLWSNKGFKTFDGGDDCDGPSSSVPNPFSSPITNASNSVINSNSAESTHSDSVKTRGEISSSGDSNKDFFFFMNNALSDFFNMGCGAYPVDEGSRFFRRKKKIPRKQTNPKFCFISESNSSGDCLDCVRKDQTVLAATGSLDSDKNSNNVDCGVGDDEEDDVEEEREKGFGVSGDGELKGYSKSEVTVIDTSCEVWKFDKFVFRKKNVWKVRDKKGKSFVFGSKKRKGNDVSGNGNGAKKKAKVLNLEFGSFEDDTDFRKPDDEKKEIHKEMPDDVGKVPKKSFQFSRSPDKSKKSGSSVILIKALPTSKISGRNLPKKCLKGRQRQPKA